MVKNSLIESVVRNVILEYSGVSDEIMDISDEILSLIFSQHREHEWRKSYVTGEYQKKFSLYLEGTKTGNLVDEVLIKLLPYDSEKMTFMDAKEWYTGLGYTVFSFSPSRNRIRLFMPWPYNDNIDNAGMTWLKSTINHEVKHAYQHNKRGGTEVSDAYANSIKHTDTDDNARPSYNLMKFYVRSLYYNLDLGEIDSHLQELYIQLNDNNGDLNRCNVYLDFKDNLREYNFLRRILYPNNRFDKRFYSEDRALFQSVINEMLGTGVTKEKFMSYCERGIKRFREHARRVIGRYRREHPEGTGSFKDYATGEIQQGSVFKPGARMKPEFLRNLTRKYNKLRYGLR